MLKVSVFSFSFKRGLPEDSTGNGGGFVFDCRALPNPFGEESLRTFTGCDQVVREFFAKVSEKVEPFANAAETLVRQSIEAYVCDGRTHLQVAFGCTGGQHRSVYFAERMAESLRKLSNVEIELTHAAKDFWKTV
jgi:RNase adaptor protein for sRNA GlmZ degradation